MNIQDVSESLRNAESLLAYYKELPSKADDLIAGHLAVIAKAQQEIDWITDIVTNNAVHCAKIRQRIKELTKQRISLINKAGLERLLKLAEEIRKAGLHADGI